MASVVWCGLTVGRASTTTVDDAGVALHDAATRTRVTPRRRGVGGDRASRATKEERRAEQRRQRVRPRHPPFYQPHGARGYPLRPGAPVRPRRAPSPRRQPPRRITLATMAAVAPSARASRGRRRAHPPRPARPRRAPRRPVAVSTAARSMQPLDHAQRARPRRRGSPARSGSPSPCSAPTARPPRRPGAPPEAVEAAAARPRPRESLRRRRRPRRRCRGPLARRPRRRVLVAARSPSSAAERGAVALRRGEAPRRCFRDGRRRRGGEPHRRAGHHPTSGHPPARAVMGEGRPRRCARCRCRRDDERRWWPRSTDFAAALRRRARAPPQRARPPGRARASPRDADRHVPPRAPHAAQRDPGVRGDSPSGGGRAAHRGAARRRHPSSRARARACFASSTTCSTCRRWPAGATRSAASRSTSRPSPATWWPRRRGSPAPATSPSPRRPRGAEVYADPVALRRALVNPWSTPSSTRAAR